MWKLLDQRGAEYPAEHNVGHLYEAKPELQAFYRKLDPCNAFNPGIGKTSKCSHWLTYTNGIRQQPTPKLVWRLRRCALTQQ